MLPFLRVCIVLLCTVLLSGSAFSAETASRPNIIVILADDLGYETIRANGGESYQTPVLDKLAATGVRFEQCYVQPLCTPTRAQLMTGQYNIRNYINFGLLNPQSRTFGNFLRDAGYATCITGKWQLGREAGLPKKFGFDEHCLWQHTRRPPRYANPGLEINGVEKDFTNGEYGPDIVNDFAMDFISRHKTSPFFLYYPMMLTHGPYQPTPDSKTWDPKAVGEDVNKRPEHFADMVAYMDKLVGKLLARLDQAGVRDNTLIVFIGDNGTGKGTPSMFKGREVIGGKGTTTTMGMHVPLIVSWPAKISTPKVTADLVDSTDVLPTICDAAGVKLPTDAKIDGRSFLAELNGENPSPRQWIYSWYSPRQANDLSVREFAFTRDFKLYRGGEFGEFIDLRTDPAEKHPMPVQVLTGEAATAAKLLQAAITQFRTARPNALDDLALERPTTPAKEKKKAKKKND